MNYSYGITRPPSCLIFGLGQRAALGRVATSLGKRALICTDQRLSNSPLIREAQADLSEQGVESRIFDGTDPELPLGGILDCVSRYRAFDPEVLIGIGGGSCMDLAKVASLLLTYPDNPISKYYGELKVPGRIKPVVAIPTTAGTGSEVTPVAVIGDPERSVKVGISSPWLIPHTAICDPELTLSCPSSLTGLSGADALAHAIEAFTAIRRVPDPAMASNRVFVGKNVLSDHYALVAIKLISGNLAKAVEHGSDIEARSAVMLGSTYAGLAFGTAGTCAAHAIQYPVGAKTHTPHGLGIGTLLPYTMEFNKKTSEREYAQVAQAMGLGPFNSDHDATQATISAIRTLFHRIGIPNSLRDLGVREEDLNSMAEQSLGATRLIENNPRALDLDSIRSILDHSLRGA